MAPSAGMGDDSGTNRRAARMGAARRRDVTRSTGGNGLTLLGLRRRLRRNRLMLLARLLQSLVDAEACRLLAWWELLERLQELADHRLRGNQEERAVRHPLAGEHGGVLVGTLERVAPQVVDLRHAHRDERLLPDAESMRALLDERRFPVPEPQGHQVAVVAPVEEALARVLLHLTLEIGQQVEAVDA